MKTLKKWPLIIMIMLGSVFGSSSCEEQLAERGVAESPEVSPDGNDDDDPQPVCPDCDSY